MQLQTSGSRVIECPPTDDIWRKEFNQVSSCIMPTWEGVGGWKEGLLCKLFDKIIVLIKGKQLIRME